MEMGFPAGRLALWGCLAMVDVGDDGYISQFLVLHLSFSLL